MKNENIKLELLRLEQRVASLPRGYISKKTINGNVQYYRQWKENGKVKSKYIKKGELEEMEKKIAERREAEQRIIELNRKIDSEELKSSGGFYTNVILGRELKDAVQKVDGLEKRECLKELKHFLTGGDFNKVCVVYGLRRTGKTTMLLQAIHEMSEEEFEKTAYIKISENDGFKELRDDLRLLYSSGYRNVFVDEVTLLEKFIDRASLFSDVFAIQGMRIVLSGTDSLSFWLAKGNELYDRANFIHTTFIPFKEHAKLLGTDDIDDYISYGGTLLKGSTDFDNEHLVKSSNPFINEKGTREYIDTAIAQNIQKSLSFFRDGEKFRHLLELYEAGELTNAIQRIIEKMNHKFAVKTVLETFKSHDLGSLSDLLNKRNIDTLDYVDIETVTNRVMESLDIRNKEHLTIPVTEIHVAEIKEFLEALDLVVECPLEYNLPEAKAEKRYLFSQPGMRFCQAQVLVQALMKDEFFAGLNLTERNKILQLLLDDVRGKMLEDIVLLETLKTHPRGEYVFKYDFGSGEFDMAIYNEKTYTSDLYEIKHSKGCSARQYRWLVDEDKVKGYERKIGEVSKKIVLYRGPEFNHENGVLYRNAEKYLKEREYPMEYWAQRIARKLEKEQAEKAPLDETIEEAKGKIVTTEKEIQKREFGER